MESKICHNLRIYQKDSIKPNAYFPMKFYQKFGKPYLCFYLIQE